MLNRPLALVEYALIATTNVALKCESGPQFLDHGVSICWLVPALTALGAFPYVPRQAPDRSRRESQHMAWLALHDRLDREAGAYVKGGKWHGRLL